MSEAQQSFETQFRREPQYLSYCIELQTTLLEHTGSIYHPSLGGIFFPSGKKIAILNSKRGTLFYDDKFLPHVIAYTLQGQKGDQDESHWKNKRLMDTEQVEYVYIYESYKVNGKPHYAYYGKYRYSGNKRRYDHVGSDGKMRKITTLLFLPA